ncbi:MAG: ABC transporter permease [Bacteroidota bacterium]
MEHGNQGASPARIAWRRFRSFGPGMIGLGYLLLCLLVAVFANGLSPDSSRHANLQILELANMPPGTTVESIRLPLLQHQASQGGAWLGRPASYQLIPLAPGSDWELTPTHLRYQHWSGVMDSVTLTQLSTEGIWDRERMTRSGLETRTFWMGTDAYGRDVMSRVLQGSRVSLAVGLLSVLVSLVIGVSLGTLAGFFGGWVDKIIMWLISVMWAIPTLLLALALSFVLGKGFWQLFVAIGISMWVEVARMVRGQILLVRELPFAEAGTALGFTSGRLMWRHILPNVLSPIIVIAVANFGAAVLIESGLSFLGIGVEVPIPSWGRMIYEGYTYIVFESGKWLAFFPGMALILLIVSINLVGIGLRDALDVRLAE